MADKMMRIALRGTDGNAKSAKSDNEGNQFVRLSDVNLKTSNKHLDVMDFKGKTSNNLSLPHIAKMGAFKIEFGDGGRVVSPRPDSNYWQEFGQGYYDIISDKDSRTVVNSRTTKAGEYSCQLFSFNIVQYFKDKGIIPSTWSVDDLIGKIRSFDIVWKGRGSAGNLNGCKMHFWRYSNERYDGFVSSHDSSDVEQIITSSKMLNPKGELLIDEEGLFHVMVRTTHPSNGVDESVITTNYISLENVEYVDDYIQTDVSKSYDDDTKSLRVYITNESLKSEQTLYAYDKKQDRIKVSVEDSVARKAVENLIQYYKRPTEVETIFAGAINPGETLPAGVYISKYKGEHETRLLVNIDQSPWRLTVGSGPFSIISNPTTYPDTSNVNDVFPNEYGPLHILPIYNNAPITSEATWQDAYSHRQLNDFQIRLTNQSDKVATATIKVMRIFK